MKCSKFWIITEFVSCLISESSPNHNHQIDGGAMQVTFCKLSVDFYPFHEAGELKAYYIHTFEECAKCVPLKCFH